MVKRLEDPLFWPFVFFKTFVIREFYENHLRVFSDARSVLTIKFTRLFVFREFYVTLQKFMLWAFFHFFPRRRKKN